MLITRNLIFGSIFLTTFLNINSSFAGDIWKQLAKGGYVVLIRHAYVMQGSTSGSPLVRDPSCKKERMLSAKGKNAAKILGQRFIKYKIPISRVLHSPFCRTTDSAQYAFNRGVGVSYLSLLEILNSTESAKQTEKLNKIIGSYKGKGNLVLVTHRPNISAISFEQASYLDFIVLKPKGGNKYDEVGLVKFTK